jgi:hypothetical protein
MFSSSSATALVQPPDYASYQSQKSGAAAAAAAHAALSLTPLGPNGEPVSIDAPRDRAKKAALSSTSLLGLAKLGRKQDEEEED